jgi:hypothetical protein
MGFDDVHHAMLRIQINQVACSEERECGFPVERSEPGSFIRTAAANTEPLLETRKGTIA